MSETTHFANLACRLADAEPECVGVLSGGVLNDATVIKYEGGGIASIFMSGNDRCGV